MDAKGRLLVIVGGVLLVGMVAWILIPGGTPEVPQSEEFQPLVESTEPAAPPAPEPATEPALPPAPEIDPFAATTELPTPPVEVGPSLTPVDNVDAWARALDGPGQEIADTPPSGIDAFTSAAPTSEFTNPPVDSSSTVTVIPADPTPAGVPSTYTIAAGDSLYAISERFYGSSRYVNRIIAANPGIDPRRLKVGQKINLPDIKESASSAVSSGTGSTPAGDTYKVQAGDSLQKIARKLYGDPARWEDIYKANRAAIGPDPSRIRAGMVLKVPAR